MMRGFIMIDVAIKVIEAIVVIEVIEVIED
jgi:hypothetical protein